MVWWFTPRIRKNTYSTPKPYSDGCTHKGCKFILWKDLLEGNPWISWNTK
jgi:hypothetical protein